ncbi:MAG: M23 family metallopeptidase [Myxococcota bacterium]
MPLVALVAATVTADPKTLVLVWPVPSIAVTSLYGYRADPLVRTERFHAGIDIEGAYGELVSASADGRVIAAGWHRGHGRFVEIEHLGGYVTRYAHLSQVLVFANTFVRAGTHIGRIGNSGRSTGPHLHFEVLRQGTPIDPLDALDQPLHYTDER